jgi:hypothetical protein
MRRLCKLLLLVIGLIGVASYQSFAGTPQATSPQLSSEQAQVYSDFLDRFSKLNFKFLSNRTFSFDLSTVGKDAPCLKGLQFERTGEPSATVHLLDANILRSRSVHMIGDDEESEILKHRDVEMALHKADSKTAPSGTATDLGVLTLSEIVFDKSRQFAVLRYILLCGTRCNSGAILVLEKIGSHWTPVRHACSVTMNQGKPRS